MDQVQGLYDVETGYQLLLNTTRLRANPCALVSQLSPRQHCEALFWDVSLERKEKVTSKV